MLLFAEAAESTPHVPILVRFVNEFLGTYAYEFEMRFTKPLWDKFFARFGTTAEGVFGPYTPQTAIPWYTVMFIVSCIITVTIIWILKGKLSAEEPGAGQQTLELSVLSVENLLKGIVGENGLKYFPVVMTFATLILVSNLLGFFPLFVTPTSATSVTFALGLSSFIYYNYIGIRENGLLRHLKHFGGPIWWIAWFIFPIELISNFIRPFSLGVRLFGNMFADEKVAETVAGIYPPFTQFGVPVLLMPLGLFVAFVQTFVFILLSMLYLSEVSHAPHSDHGTGSHSKGGGDDEKDFQMIAAVLT